MIPLKNLSKVASTAALVAYGSSAAAAIPPGTAVADAFLSVSNFTILLGDDTPGLDRGKGTELFPLLADGRLEIDFGNVGAPGTLPTDPIDNGNISSNGDTTSNLNSVAGVSNQTTNVAAATSFLLNSFQGAGTFTPGAAALVGENSTYGPDSYVAGHSSTYGNALSLLDNEFSPADLGQTPNGNLSPVTIADLGGPTNFIGLDPWPAGADCGEIVGDCVHVQSQVNLVGSNQGSGSSNQGLGLEFQLGINSNPQAQGTDGETLEIAFNADGFRRAALGQDSDFADAIYSWVLGINGEEEDGTPFSLTWLPGFGVICSNGLCDQVGEFNLNPFLLVQNSEGDTELNNVDDNSDPMGWDEFELEAFIPAGDYTFSISHSTIANAALVVVPEPGTLALMGLGILGAGVARRRAKR